MLTLRRANEKDLEFFWIWANDGPTRKASFFRTSAITWENHVEWFRNKLADPVTIIYVAINEAGDPVGQVSFDRVQNSPGEACIHIGIAPDFRGKGLATEAIILGSETIFRETDIRLIRAYIRPENTASIKTFAKAGFKDGERQIYAGIDAVYKYLEPRSEA